MEKYNTKVDGLKESHEEFLKGNKLKLQKT